MLSRLRPFIKSSSTYQMPRTLPHSKIKQVLTQQVDKRYAVNQAFNYKTASAKQFATDNSGKHAAQTSAICAKPDCAEKECKTPCGDVMEMEIDGHYTHNPPPVVKSEHVGSTDFAGQPKDQYFVKPGTKPVISAEELKNLTEDDMKPNVQATAYGANILDKIK